MIRPWVAAGAPGAARYRWRSLTATGPAPVIPAQAGPPVQRGTPPASPPAPGDRDDVPRRRPEQAPEPRTARRAGRTSATRIALVYPELLGTYGDGGNALVLAQRLRWRGLPAEIVEVPAGAAVPNGCDIYLLGGGEDEPQALAAEGMRRGDPLPTAVAGGAAVLAVCAGYQVIGASFPASDGKIHDGVGLIDVETRRSFDGPDRPLPPRAVGDIVVDPDPALALPVLTGYENHGGRTRPLPGATAGPLGTVRRGTGNGIAARTDGMVRGRVVATYLHGPVLAQNPALADLLLGWVHGALAPLDRPVEAVALREARRRALDVD